MANRKQREKRDNKICSYFSKQRANGYGKCEIISDLSSEFTISETQVRNILKKEGLI
jgi:hypothetical protein